MYSSKKDNISNKLILKLTWINNYTLFPFYWVSLKSSFKIKFLISIVTLIARHPCIKPTTLFMLHCIQVPVFHSPDYVTLNKIFFSKRIFTDHAYLIVKTSFKTRGHYNRPWQSSEECWNKRTQEKNVPNRSEYYLNWNCFDSWNFGKRKFLGYIISRREHTWVSPRENIP